MGEGKYRCYLWEDKNGNDIKGGRQQLSKEGMRYHKPHSNLLESPIQSPHSNIPSFNPVIDLPCTTSTTLHRNLLPHLCMMGSKWPAAPWRMWRCQWQSLPSPHCPQRLFQWLCQLLCSGSLCYLQDNTELPIHKLVTQNHPFTITHTKLSIYKLPNRLNSQTAYQGLCIQKVLNENSGRYKVCEGEILVHQKSYSDFKYF